MVKKKAVPEVAALSDVLAALADLDDAAKSWVLNTAANRHGLAVGGGGGAAVGSGAAGVRGATANNQDPTPKEFMKGKAPQSDVQRVACLAFYLTHHKETPHFKSIDLTRLNTDAAGPKINMTRATDNAVKRNHYLAVAGAGKRQITSHGEDVVEALPDQTEVKELDAKGIKRANKSGKGRKKGRKGAKAK